EKLIIWCGARLKPAGQDVASSDLCLGCIPCPVHCNQYNSSQSPPGQPQVIGCRSYDKETVTCWWEPGSDGGLSTNYTVLYWTERTKTEQECPDYHSSGPYTCFFDKTHSSLWMYYFVYVKATNALGSNVSDIFRFEIGDVGKRMQNTKKQQLFVLCNFLFQKM
ncbi:hypothetical protein AB205_0088750, partial [Aquarana catesbeiana]